MLSSRRGWGRVELRIRRLLLATMAALALFVVTAGALHAATLVVDLAGRPPRVRVLGVQATGQAGTALAVGDLNGDGQADVAVGAPGESPTDVLTRAGRIYVFFSAGTLTGTIPITDADLVLEGIEVEEWAGFTLAVGDVGSSDASDLVVGAPYADGGSGRVYVLWGPLSSGSRSLGSADVVITGTQQESAGYALAIGDLDGDGGGDLAIGAPTFTTGALTQTGRGYVFLSRQGGPSGGILSSQADLIIQGNAAYAACGTSLTIADVSGDGTYADLALGAPFDPPEANCRGEVYVFYGSMTLTGLLSASDADVQINGVWNKDWLGRSLAAGDVDGDGVADLAIGANGDESGGSGRKSSTYVFWGGGGFTGTLEAAQADVILRSGQGAENTGYWLDLANMDGDDYADLAIGARLVSIPNRNQGGRVYILYGSRLTTTQNLYLGADVVIEAPTELGRMGSSLACGPLFGPSYDDLIVGAPGTDDESGAVYFMEMPSRGVRIEPDYSLEVEEVGAHVVYTHVLTNLCIITDTFHLTYTVVEGSGWGHSLEPLMVTVPGLATETVYFHVTAPLQLGQVVDVSVVRATSAADSSATDSVMDRSEGGGRKVYLPLVFRSYR